MSDFYKKLSIEGGIFIGIVIVLSALLVFFRSHVTKTVQEISAVRQEVLRRSAAIQSFALLRSQYASHAQTSSIILHNVIPIQENLINFSKELQSVAARRGIEIGFSFAGETVPSGNTPGYLKFEITAKGSLGNLYQFIDDLYNFRYIITLNQLSLNEEGGTKLIIQGQVFYRSES